MHFDDKCGNVICTKISYTKKIMSVFLSNNINGGSFKNAYFEMFSLIVNF